eukprot:8441413-Alexandrium_andersonii.AAC.1
MSASLVGSEMCIRDSVRAIPSYYPAQLPRWGVRQGSHSRVRTVHTARLARTLRQASRSSQGSHGRAHAVNTAGFFGQ